MAGDLIGNTVLTGLIVTNTPGSAQTNLPLPISGGPAVVQFQSGVTFSVQSGAQAGFLGGSSLTLQSGSSLIVGSGATVTFAGCQFSMRTVNAASLSSIGPTVADNMVVGFQLAASGMSLLVRSGNSVYFFNSAASVGASGA